MSGFFRMEVKVVSRTSERSANVNSSLHAAAYIAADKYQQRAINGAVYISGQHLDGADYSHKRGVLFSDIILPDGAPDKFHDPEILWSTVEAAEGTYLKADLYREWTVSFDASLSLDDMKRVAAEFARSLAAEGMAVHYAIHDQKHGNSNFHAHFLAPTRSIRDGKFVSRKCLPRTYQLDAQGNKIPSLDRHGNQRLDKRGQPVWKRAPMIWVDAFNDGRIGNVDRWRRTFCEIENQYLSPEQQVSPLSYEKQGRADTLPAPDISKAAWKIQQKLDRQIDLLPPERKREFLQQILKDLQKDYRREYYQPDLQTQLRRELNARYKYQPQSRYTSKDQNLLARAFAKLLQFWNHLLSEATKPQEKIVYARRVDRAERDLLIIYSTGLTRALESRLFKGECEMRKETLKALGTKIRELEQQLKTATEKELDAYERQLRECREQLRNAQALARTGCNDYRAAASNICKLSRTHPHRR